MAKKVIYIGGDYDNYYCTSDWTQLTVGNIYEVATSKDRGYQMDYSLKGIKGEFPAAWFKEVKRRPNVYIAIGYQIPKVGEEYYCQKLGFENGRPNLLAIYTSAVKDLEYIGNNIYIVNTTNSIYLVNVNK